MNVLLLIQQSCTRYRADQSQSSMSVSAAESSAIILTPRRGFNTGSARTAEGRCVALFDDDYSPCDYCESSGSEYCRLICGNPCYGCSDWDDEKLECKSDGACGKESGGAKND